MAGNLNSAAEGSLAVAEVVSRVAAGLGDSGVEAAEEGELRAVGRERRFQ